MNLPAAIKAASLIFKLRKLIALAVVLEFFVKRRVNKSDKKSKKNVQVKQDEVKTLVEDNIDRAKQYYQDFLKEYKKSRK